MRSLVKFKTVQQPVQSLHPLLTKIVPLRVKCLSDQQIRSSSKTAYGLLTVPMEP